MRRLGENTSHYLVVNTVSGWARQASAALDKIEAANGGVLPAKLRDGYDIDQEAFSSLIEALYALGPDGPGYPDEELIRLAGLRDIGEVLGG